MYLDYSKGGLRVPNIELMSKGLKLAWISRLIQDQSKTEAWRVIPDFYFKRYGDLNFLLHCNYARKCLDQFEIPLFYKQILLYFGELEWMYGHNVGQDMILFDNSEIQIEGKSICYNKWIEKGVLSIHDVLHETSRKLLTYQEFKQKHINCNFLNYLHVISAIPNHLLVKARHQHLDRPHFDKTNFIFQLSNSVSIHSLKAKSRDYYWLLNKSDIKATGLIK